MTLWRVIDIMETNDSSLLKNKIHNNSIIFYKKHILQGILTMNGIIHSKESYTFLWYNQTNSCGIMIGFNTIKKFSVTKTSKDRILIVKVTIEEVPFILVNLYNANTK